MNSGWNTGQNLKGIRLLCRYEIWQLYTFYKEEQETGLFFKDRLNFYKVWSIYTAVQLFLPAL
jgi:hypothetical protein